jgi:hypothetical protein
VDIEALRLAVYEAADYLRGVGLVGAFRGT